MLQAGDRIRLRRGDDDLGIKSQSRAVVTEVDTRRERVHLRLDDGTGKELSNYNPIFEGCDYGFNISTWEFRQKAVENVIAVTDGAGPSLGVVGDVRTELDRRAKNAVLLANDPGKLNERLKHAGEQLLELGKTIKGLITGPDGYIAKALADIEQKREKERERKRNDGMGMRM